MTTPHRKIDFRFPNHGGCMALAAWLADQFDQGKRTSITMEDDIMCVHSREYVFRMSIQPASNGCFCCHIQADDTVLTAVRLAHSDSQVNPIETARFIANALKVDAKSLRVYAANILRDDDLMRVLSALVPGVESDLRVLALEHNFQVADA